MPAVEQVSTMDSLLVIHVNIFLIKRDLLTQQQQTLEKVSPSALSEEGAATSGYDDELDLGKTKENLWQLITL